MLHFKISLFSYFSSLLILLLVVNNNFHRVDNDQQNGHLHYTTNWAEKFRRNLKLPSQLLERISEDHSNSISHSNTNNGKNRPTKIPEELAQGKEGNVIK